MPELLVIGDVHAKFSEYYQILKDTNLSSVQVGDMGIGFGTMPNKLINIMPRKDARFIRGNHDNPHLCYGHDQYIDDGTLDIDEKVMYIGGAWSIDQSIRTVGVDWWPEEELSALILDFLVAVYDIHKPSTMITHTCPRRIAAAHLCAGPYHGSRTEDAFDTMLDFHKPDRWIFGHWHQSFDAVIDDTRFICLNELETKVIEI